MKIFRKFSLGTVSALTAGVLLMGAAPASAATTTYTATGLTSAVAGTTVTVSTTIKASATVVAAKAGICARNQDNKNFDFPKDVNVTLSPAGTTLTKTAVLPVGTYTMFTCASINGQWPTIGSAKSFTVNSSDGSIPELPTNGWTTVFSDSFSTPVAKGQWPASATPTGGKWGGYTGAYDTARIGKYTNSIVSQHDGMLDINIKTTNGVPQVAAPFPMVNGKWGGAAYQRVTMKFKSDSLPGYKAAFLLWPDSGNWNDGEIDFPEGPVNSTMSGFNHCPGKPSNNCEWVNTSTRYADGNWHTSVIEWTPTAVKLYLDGNVVMTEDDPGQIPSKAMHYIAQLETNYSRPDASVEGHFYIDSFSVEYRTP